MFRNRSFSSRTLLSLFSIFATTFVIAGPAHGQQRMGIPGPKTTKLPDHEVELPMERFHRLPMVELMINDTGPYKMIVDTGAAGLVVQPELAKKLELPNPPGMPKDLRLRTPGGQVPATLHYTETLNLGEAEFTGVWTVATALPFGDEMDGVIGMNIFKECLLTYDYPANRIVLSKGELADANGADILEYKTPRMPDSHPFVDLTIDGKTNSTLIDSGMSGWFAVPKKTSSDFKFLSGPVEFRMGQSVGPNRTQSMAGRVSATFEVGGAKVKNPIVILGSEPMIGTLFLENFCVTFDGKNKRVRFSRESKEPLTQTALRSVGFSLTKKAKAMHVQFVLPKSDAASKGLKVGDIVTSIEGKPAAEMHNSEKLRELIQSQDSLKIQFRNAGRGTEIKSMEVKILELVK